MIVTALRFMIFDRTKSFGVLIGIFLSTFLIGQQYGIFSFLTGLMASLVNNSQADIWVIDRQSRNANEVGLIDLRYLYALKSIEGVRYASPFVLAAGKATSEQGNPLSVLLIGSDDLGLILGPLPSKIAQGEKYHLLHEAAVSTDVFDDKSFGQNMKIGTQFEINGQQVYVALRTHNLRGFGPPQIFMPLTRARFLGNVSPLKMNGVLLQTTQPKLTESVIAHINRNFPNLRAWSKEGLRKQTVSEILGSSGIGSSTGTLVVFALITGVLIIGLTLFSSVQDRIRDYGTMKALGATTRYLAKLLFFQALLFAITGFLLAWGLLELFAHAVVSTGLFITFSWKEILALFITTTSISVLGMLFALLRVKGVEPASVFRN